MASVTPKDGVKAPAGDAKATTAAPAKKVSFLQLFRFATTGDKVWLVVGIFFSAANGIIFPLFSLIFAGLLDAFWLEDAVTVISRYAGYLALIAIGTFICSALGLGAVLYSAERQGTRMRVAYMQALLRQPLSFHDTHHTTDAATRMSEDVGAVLKALGEPLANTVQFGVQFIAGIVLGFSRDAKLSAVVCAFMPLLALAGVGMKSVLSNVGKQEADAYARAGEVSSEAISNIRVIQSYAGEEAEVRRYDNHLTKAEMMGRKKGVAQGLSMGSMWFFMLLTYAAALYYGGVLIVDSRSVNPSCANPTLAITGPNCVTGGTVINVFFAIIIAAFALGQAAPNFSSFSSATGAAATVFSLIDEKPSIDNLGTQGLTPDPASCKGRIEFKNVTFAYPSRPDVKVLENFSLVIEGGQNFAVVGPSGSGKSSLIQLLQRFYDPQEGQILLDGVDIRELNVQWVRERMGLVLQDSILFQTTIARNIAMGLISVAKASATLTDAQVEQLMPQIEAAAKAANAHGFISALPQAYKTQVGEKGGKLSGGQRQRVCIARALMRSPQIMLCDEATSALDSQSERAVQKAIDALLRGAATATTSAKKMTSITIAHRLSTIRYSDCIVVLEGGRVTASGSHDQLMAEDKASPKGLYRRLVEQQALGDGTRSRAQSAEGAGGAVAPSSPGQVQVAGAEGSPASEEEEEAEPVSADHYAVPVKGEAAASGDGKGEKEKEKEAKEPELPAVPFGRVMTYQKPERPHLVLAVFSALVAGAIMPCFSIIFSEITNAFYQDNAYIQAKTPALAGWFVLLAVVSLVSQVLTWSLFAFVGEKLTRRLRTATYRALLFQDIAFFDKEENSSGKLTSRLSEEAALVKATTGEKLALSSLSISSLIAGLVIAFTASWQVALLVLAIFPLIAAVGAGQMKMMAGMTNVKESAEAGNVVMEATTSIRTVHAFGLQNILLTQFKEVLVPVEKKGVKRGWSTGAGLGATMFVMFASYSLVFWAGGRFVGNGWTTFQAVIQAFFAIVMAAQGAGNSSGLATDAAKADKAKRSIFATIDSRPPIDARSQVGERPSATRGEIELRDVHFRYPTRPDQEVLKGLSLKIEAGKTTALVSQSGGGKSSIIQLLQRFYDPQEGEVLLDGINIKALPPHFLRSQLALVPQQPPLFADSIEYNIGYGSAAEKPAPDAGVAVDAGSGAAIPSSFVHDPLNEEAAKAANAHDFIMTFPHRYATHCGTAGSALSGGQKGRVAIARAIRRRPAVFLLDEATAALDNESERIVQASIDALVNRSGGPSSPSDGEGGAGDGSGLGVTKLIVAHKLATIRNADKICVLSEGRLVEEGTHVELLAKEGGLYRQLALAQDPTALSALPRNGKAGEGASSAAAGAIPPSSAEGASPEGPSRPTVAL